ncbi:MAG: ABC-F family ATP-binding cassette domain-containing protein [Thermomicrobiales bacterium]|nr:ABC-F family ATP-binding cassette domain-containing protein [Thermomicrobiales bacterium]
MLTVNSVSVRYGDRLVLDGISFTINKHDRVGLIGPNGAGKTTLLGVLAGLSRPDEGSVSLAPGARIGYLRQGFAELDGGTLGDALDAQLDGLLGNLDRLSAATAKLSEPGVDADSAIEAYAVAGDAFERSGGYQRLDDLTNLLARFGLDGVPHETSLTRLSGGEKTRAGLAALLASCPDLLLLDEPTNHLDLDALGWLESFIVDYQGAVVIVSHDRAFIDATVDRIIELDDVTHSARLYTGNYSDYLTAKRRAAEAHAEAFERQQREIARIERDVRAVASHAAKTENETTNDYLRGRSKKVARTAKVRERKLERLLDSTERIDKPGRRWGLALDLESTGETGRDVIVAENLGFRYGDRVIFVALDLHIRAGERVALTGPNGAGKSTLLRVITGQLAPASGRARLGAAVKAGVFSQEQENVRLDANALDQVRDAAPTEESEARSFLHKFLFTGENVLRPAAELSYGERARLSLALLVRRGANLLVLDEPLNHLDLQSRERFEEALLGFDGTLVTVLHDRYAIARLANRVLELRDGRLHER